MQDVSAGVLIAENVAALQEVLWKFTRQFASNPAHKKKMTHQLTCDTPVASPVASSSHTMQVGGVQE